MLFDAAHRPNTAAQCDAGHEHVEIAGRLVREHSIHEFAERFPEQNQAAVAAMACAYKRLQLRNCHAMA